MPDQQNFPQRFTGKTVLVTGAGTGFGAEIAVRAAQEGARVVVHYNRSREGAEDTAKRIEQAGSEAALVQADIDAAVCSVQNGIGNEEVIAQYVPRVIRGTTIVAGHVPEPGVVHLDGDPMALIDDAAQHAAGHQPSMLQDVLARRATEIGVLNGGIVRQAQEVGVRCHPTRLSPPSSTAWRAPGPLRYCGDTGDRSVLSFSAMNLLKLRASAVRGGRDAGR